VLTAVDLKTSKVAWSFQTDGARQNLAGLSNPDGTTNYEAVFTENFYDNMLIGVYKLFATGAILSSPVITGDALYFVALMATYMPFSNCVESFWMSTGCPPSVFWRVGFLTWKRPAHNY
jgi:hypothetical protein